MRNYKSIAFLAAWLSCVVASGQSLSFLELGYEFGSIYEVDGLVTHQFVFVNDGLDSLRITSVTTSCGCTTSDWDKNALALGDTGRIVAQFNPDNKPGAFRKSIRVESNAGAVVLYISGNVVSRTKTIEERLPETIGAMRLEHTLLNIGRITTEKPISKSFEVYNSSDSMWTVVSGSLNAPAYLAISLEPMELPAKTVGKMIVTVDPAKIGELGFQNFSASFLTTDALAPTKEISFFMTVEEYFPPMAPEALAKTPRLVLDKLTHDFGSITQNSVPRGVITLTNTGKSPLSIRSIKANCDCISYTLSTYDLESGKSTELLVSFNPNRRSGRQYKTLTIFSNDPVSPTQVLSIKADVQ